MPDALHLAASLGHDVAGEEHVLLAWLEGELPSGLRGALDARGVTGSRLRDALAEVAPAEVRQTEVRWGTRGGPTYSRANGRARGLELAGRGRARTREHVLRACLWDLGGTAADTLRSIGADPAEVLALAGVRGGGPSADAVVAHAEAAAVALGDGFVGCGHLVLALLDGHPDGDARRALESCGVTRSAYADRHVAWLASSYPPASRLVVGRAPAVNPALQLLLGRAEGFAAGHDVVSVSSGDLAVGWLWSDYGASVAELESLGTSGPALVNALGAGGGGVPDVAPPEPDRRQWGEDVDVPVDRLHDVLRHLGVTLPSGDWGWNTYDGRAWVTAVATVDLAAIVEEAIGPRAHAG